MSTARPAYDLTTGVVDVRPLRFTDVLDGSFAVYRSSMRVAVPLVLVVMVPLQLLSAYVQREALRFGLGGVLDDPAAAEVLLGQGGPTAGILAALAGQVVVGPLLAGALAAVAIARTTGRDITVGRAVRAAVRRAGWLIGAYVLGLLARGAVLLVAAVGAAAGVDALVAAGIAMGIPVAMAVTPLLAVITPALMVDDRPGPQAIRHAVTLAARSWWRVAGVLVGTSLVFNLVALLLAGIPNVVGLAAGLGFGWALVAVGNTLTQLVTAPLTAAAMVLLHTDLRVRQEGLDFDVILARLQASDGRPGPVPAG